VAPGETGKILVKMSTQAHTSEISKEIKVETNDPSAPLITLNLKARVFEAMRVSPRVINFGRMAQRQSETREILVENSGKKPFRVKKIVAIPASKSPNAVSVSPGEPFALRPGEGRKLAINFSTGTAPGFFSENLILETDIPYLQQKKIYLHVEVKNTQENEP